MKKVNSCPTLLPPGQRPREAEGWRRPPEESSGNGIKADFPKSEVPTPASSGRLGAGLPLDPTPPILLFFSPAWI